MSSQDATTWKESDTLLETCSQLPSDSEYKRQLTKEIFTTFTNALLGDCKYYSKQLLIQLKCKLNEWNVRAYIQCLATICAVFCIWVAVVMLSVIRIPDEYDYSLVHSSAETNDIAIIITVSNSSDYDNYTLALDTLKCYASHNGYQLHLLNLTTYENVEEICNQTDVFFKRHCVVVDFLEKNVDTIENVMYLDADMAVVNPHHKIQDYFEANKNVEIMFYDRYFNFEIAAGSYLMRNSDYARSFIKYWADYYYRLPNSFHGTDNGCLHQVFMEQHFGRDNPTSQKCYSLWEQATNFTDLGYFEACTRHYLGMHRSLYCNGKVKIFRKGNFGWTRDGWLTQTKFGPSDFLLHGWKVYKLGKEWHWPFLKSFDLSTCQRGSDVNKNWVFNPRFQVSDGRILRVLSNIRNNVFNSYFNILQHEIYEYIE